MDKPLCDDCNQSVQRDILEHSSDRCTHCDDCNECNQLVIDLERDRDEQRFGCDHWRNACNQGIEVNLQTLAQLDFWRQRCIKAEAERAEALVRLQTVLTLCNDALSTITDITDNPSTEP